MNAKPLISGNKKKSLKKKMKFLNKIYLRFFLNKKKCPLKNQ